MLFTISVIATNSIFHCPWQVQEISFAWSLYETSICNDKCDSSVRKMTIVSSDFNGKLWWPHIKMWEILKPKIHTPTGCCYCCCCSSIVTAVDQGLITWLVMWLIRNDRPHFDWWLKDLNFNLRHGKKAKSWICRICWISSTNKYREINLRKRI